MILEFFVKLKYQSISTIILSVGITYSVHAYFMTSKICLTLVAMCVTNGK